MSARRYPRADLVGGSAVIASHKYRRDQQGAAAMEFNDDDDLTDEGADVMAHRARARDLLTEISRQAKEGLSKQGINLDLFFVIPSDSIITFGTTLDPDPSDTEWALVSEVVAGVVQRLLGLAGTRCRAVVCATTRDQECCDAAS
jgi:hypothetical protein